MNILNQAGLVTMTLLLFGAHSWADTVSLPLTDDAFVLGVRPTANYGAWDDIFVTSYGPKHGLVRFDAASLAGLEINSATLTLYLNDIANAGTVSIHAITSSWDESSVTWNNQPPSEATATAVVDLAVADEGSVISIDVTDVVRRWADGSLADGGFLLVTTDAIKAYFDAKEQPGGLAATLEVDTGPPAYSGEAIVLDLSNADNCIIDEPGYYVLDRSWLLTMENQEKPNGSCPADVHITSGGVTLDLRGFSIRGGMERLNYEPVLWIDTESSVTLRDGTLTAIFVAIEASVASDRHGVTLDRIRTGGAVLLDNRFVTVTGGRYSASMEDTLQVGESSRVDGATLICSDAACLIAHGSSRIVNCTFDGDDYVPAMYLSGDGTIVEGNILHSYVSISGDHNVFARNISSNGDTYIEVNGTGNILEGNIGPGIVFETLRFQSTGNFYGNNRVALPGSITGADGNVDWGGNVTF